MKRKSAYLKVEQFNMLKAAIHTQAQSEKLDVQTILVTSPEISCGKSTVAVNLGAVYARSGIRTLVMGIDMQPKNQPEDKGIADILQKGVPLERCLKVSRISQLYYLPSGNCQEGATELLTTPSMNRLMEELRTRFGKIIVDSTAVTLFSDTLNFGANADGTLLVVREHATNKQTAKNAVDMLKKHPAPILGTVVNQAT